MAVSTSGGREYALPSSYFFRSASATSSPCLLLGHQSTIAQQLHSPLISQEPVAPSTRAPRLFFIGRSE
jgi:hypothetical protein